MSKFADDLNRLVAPMLGTADNQADAVEALCNAIAASIAIGSRGDVKRADRLLTGAESYIAKCLSDKLMAIRSMGL